MIDLATKADAIASYLRSSILSFEATHPELRWSCVALHSDLMVSGHLSVCFDTLTNSDTHVAAVSLRGPAWFGDDSAGRFNISLGDFAFPDWRQFNLDDWNSYYVNTDDSLHIVDLSGSHHELDRNCGDEAINEILFEGLWTLFSQEVSLLTPSTSARDTAARYGVRMYDSKFLRFEPIPVAA